jgi:hypothetical protein
VEAAAQLAANQDSGWEGKITPMRKCVADAATQARFEILVARF